jgi:hypothetical protein
LLCPDLLLDFFETNMYDFQKYLNSRSAGAQEPNTLFANRKQIKASHIKAGELSN